MAQLPAIEGMVRRPERADQGLWPLVTQVILVPWAHQQPIEDMPAEQVMLVPRALWERLVCKAGIGALAPEEVSRG